jgi:membrane fusion protein (multidrug efflux system)
LKNLLFVFLLLVLAGCTQQKDEPPVAAVETTRGTRVETMTARYQDLREEFSLPGSLEAWQDLLLAAEISGPVEWVGFQEGARVKKGALLVKIDTLSLQANLNSSRAEYELRRKTLARQQELVAEKLVSEQDMDNAVGALEMATAALRNAEIMLERARLKAPLDGLIEERLVEPGEYVKTGDPLLRLVQIDQLKVNVDVPEKDVLFLHPGDEVEVLAAQPGVEKPLSLRATLIHVSYVADAPTRTYGVRLKVDNRAATLRPGMIVRARFLRRQLDQVLAVPLYAIINRDDKKLLFVRQNDRAVARQVELGAIINGDVVVTAGLDAGDEVIVKGQHMLADGSRITLAEN